MSFVLQLLLGLALVAGGAWTGAEWERGQQAQRDQAAREARESDARQQRQIADGHALQHAETLQALNDQLGDAREQLAHRLPGRACLDPGSVRVLNATGLPQPGGAAAAQPAGAAAAAAAGAGVSLRWASDVDVAGYIALCRTRYAAVADQVNQILDIEDRRHPTTKGATHGNEDQAR